MPFGTATATKAIWQERSKDGCDGRPVHQILIPFVSLKRCCTMANYGIGLPLGMNPITGGFVEKKLGIVGSATGIAQSIENIFQFSGGSGQRAKYISRLSRSNVERQYLPSCAL